VRVSKDAQRIGINADVDRSWQRFGLLVHRADLYRSARNLSGLPGYQPADAFNALPSQGAGRRVDSACPLAAIASGNGVVRGGSRGALVRITPSAWVGLFQGLLVIITVSLAIGQLQIETAL